MVRCVALVVVSTALALGACELFAQHFWDDGEVQMFELDPLVLHRIRPNIQKRITLPQADGGARVVSRYNRFGLRGEEVNSEKGDRYRIIVYGDSNVTAMFSPLERTFPKRLEDLLSQSGHGHIEVINAGVPGWGPDQVSLKLSADLPRFNPDLIVLNVFVANDFSDLLRNKIYQLDEASGLALRDYKISASLRFNNFLGHFKILRYLKLASLRLWTGPRPLTGAGRPAPLTRGEDGALYANSELKREYDDYRKDGEIRNLLSDGEDILSIVPNAEASLLARRLMAGVLARINQMARQHATKLIVSIEPSAQDILGAQVHQLEQYPGYDRHTRTGIVESICIEHGIPRVNLFDVFSSHGESESLYFQDGHWNDRGQDLAAREIAAYVLEHRYVQ